jgi:pyruvate dehydrogenase E1 component alpha subunit
MYVTMVKIRKFEEKVYYLFLEGHVPSTLHLYIGEEAVAAGVCAHLRKEDYITSTHRPHGHAIAKGVAPKLIMAELFGKSTGCCKAKGGSMHIGDINVGMIPAIAIVGAAIPIAAGLALACKKLGTDNVTVCFFGDGAANTGAFHEGLNIAAIWDLPVVFVCENNLYAASTHVSKAMKISDIAERATAYGMPGVIVDGNDVLAVYEAAGEAILRARHGQGPTLLECKTYRQCGHSRSDPCGYRSRGEEQAWKAKDPIPMMRRRLTEEWNLFSQNELDAVDREAEALVEEALTYAESSPLPAPTDALKHVYWEGGA